MIRQLGTIAALCALSMTACDPVERSMEGHQDIVAQVDGYALTVNRAAGLLAVGAPETVPLRPSTVDRLVEIWIGYTALATLVASDDDPTDLLTEPLARFARDQELVWRLQEEAILNRAAPPVEQLRAAYEREEPFTRVEAQHILIRVPAGADSAVTDSLRARAERLRQRALSGENFSELARRFSEDPASAARGGSLGYVERGRLVPEVEAAVFSLQPGEISETVRSTYGYHIIKVTDRQVPDYEDVSEAYRTEFMQDRMTNLESLYIDSLFDAAKPRFVRGYVPLVKQLSISSRLSRISATERDAPLVTYRGGKLTVGEWADFVIKGGQDARTAFAARDSAGVAALLNELVQNELLVKAAHDEGMQLDESVVDSLAAATRRDVQGAILASGLRRHLDTEGVSVELAVDRSIAELITRQRGPRPIERLFPALIEGHVVRIYPDRFQDVLHRLVELREQGGGSERPASGVAPEARGS